MQPPRRGLEPEVDAVLRQAGWFPGRDIGNVVDAWAGQLSARFARFSRLVGQELYPLGEGGDGHYFLAIAEGVAVYGIADALWPVGTSIEEALSNLIVGRRAGPIVDDDSTE